MEKFLFQDESPLRREQLLRDNSDAIEEVTYMRQFTPEQMGEMKDELAEASIKLSDIEERKREAMNLFRAEAEPFKEEVKKLLSNIRNKAELVEEDCYKLVDLESRMVGFYNNSGELVLARPAKANELSKNIFALGATGTDNKTGK